MEVDQALEIVAGASDAELREIAAYRMHGPLVRSLAATALHGRETGAFAALKRKAGSIKRDADYRDERDAAQWWGDATALLRALSGEATEVDYESDLLGNFHG